MKINVNKTKVMITSRQEDGIAKILKCKKYKFCYLESWIIDEKCDTEIIAMAKAAFIILN